jgi:hypothetical protein
MDNRSKVKYGLTSSRYDTDHMSERAQEVTEKAKAQHRTDIKLKDWSRYNYYKSDFCEKTLKTPLKGMFEIQYENADTLTLENFREKYESKNIPLVIKGLTYDWKAKKYWNFEVICD